MAVIRDRPLAARRKHAGDRPRTYAEQNDRTFTSRAERYLHGRRE